MQETESSNPFTDQDLEQTQTSSEKVELTCPTPPSTKVAKQEERLVRIKKASVSSDSQAESMKSVRKKLKSKNESQYIFPVNCLEIILQY